MSTSDSTVQHSQQTKRSINAKESTDSSSSDVNSLGQRLINLLASGQPFYEASFVAGLLLTVCLYCLGWMFLQDGMANMEAAVYSLLMPVMAFLVLPVAVIPMLIPYYAERGTRKAWWLHALVVAICITVVAAAASLLLNLVFGGQIETAFTDALFSQADGAVTLSESQQATYARLPLIVQNISTVAPASLIACFMYVYVAARFGTKAS